MSDTGAIGRLARAWVGMVARWPVLTLMLAAALTYGAIDYTGRHLGINTDTADMISAEVPWRARYNELAERMPRRADTLILVVDGPTTEVAERAASRVADALAQARPDIEQTWVPSRDSFLRRHALVLMDEADATDVGERLIAAQPLLGRLADDASLTGLFSLVAELPAGGDAVDPASVQRLLTGLTTALDASGTPAPGTLSWQGLVTGDTLPGGSTRQFVLVRAALDYSELLPAGPLMAAAREAGRSVEAALPGVRIRVTGGTPMEHEEMDTVASGMPVSAVLALVLVTVVLLTGLRCWRTALGATVCLLMGLAWTAAFAAWAVGELNLISIAFAVLYIGLGVDYAVHFCLRFGELRDGSGNVAGALATAGSDVGASLALCAITTGIGFLAFVPTDFSGVSDLGIISAAGMFISLAATLGVLPPLLIILRARPTPRGLLPGGLPCPPKLVLAGALVLGVGALTLLPRLGFDHNPINLRDPATESVATYLDLLDDAGARPWTLSVLADPTELTALRGQLEALPEVARVRWLGDFLPDDQDARLARLDDLALALGAGFGPVSEQVLPSAGAVRLALDKARLALVGSAVATPDAVAGFAAAAQRWTARLAQSDEAEMVADLQARALGELPALLDRLDDMLLANAWGPDTLSPAIRDRWLSDDGRWRLAVEPRDDLADNTALERFVTSVQSVAPKATGTPEVNLRAAEVVVRAFVQAFVSAGVIIAVILFMLLGRAADVLLVLVPLVLAGLLTCATMVLTGLSFNFANVIALPLLLGIGVDNGVHLVHRLRNAPPASGSVLGTSTARAIVLSAATTLCSFGNLAWSPHPGTASMGWVLSIGLAMTLLATLFVLPALYVRFLGGRNRAAVA